MAQIGTNRFARSPWRRSRTGTCVARKTVTTMNVKVKNASAIPDGAVGDQVTSRRARRLTIDAEGRASLARYLESPNCDERPNDTPITIAVVHGISLPPGEFGGPGI